MPLPNLSVFCVGIGVSGRLCITLPGGAEICAPFADNKIPDPSELVNAMLGPLNAALAPLVPIFNIIDVIIAMVNCLKSIEKALGPPPDPSKLAKCFPELARKLARVLRMIPQLSIPVMIGGILDIIITGLTGMRRQILVIIKKTLRLLSASANAFKLGSVALHTVVDCANEDLSAFLTNMNANAQPIFRLILLLNAMLDLAGVPKKNQIPTGPALGTDPTTAVAPIDETIKILTVLRKAFP